MDSIKKFSPALFVIIIFCFFLPFVNLSCGGQTVMSLTGFQLITGTEYKPAGMFGQDDMFNQKSEKQNVDAQPLALLAMLAAVLGLILSFLKLKSTALFCAVVSVLGCLFLLLLKVNLDNDAAMSGQGMQGVIQLDYQFGYWLAFLLFILAAIVHWLIFKEPKSTVIPAETPPASQ
jgi:hypothetical protein